MRATFWALTPRTVAVSEDYATARMAEPSGVRVNR